MKTIDEHYMLSNDVKIPKIGFGTAPLKGDEVYRAVLNALSAGYRHIDTAQTYGNEEMVGKAIKDSNIPREEIFITSKLDARIKNYDKALEAFEETVERLDVDYLDLYLIHAPWPFDQWGKLDNVGNVKAWQALETLYKEKSVRAIGVSNFDVENLKNILWHAEEKPQVNQIKLHIGYTQTEIVEYCHAENILVEGYSPLGRGTFFDNETLKTLAEKYDVSVPQLAIRFLLQKDILPLPRSRSDQHILSNTKVDFNIEESDMDILNSLSFEE